MTNRCKPSGHFPAEILYPKDENLFELRTPRYDQEFVDLLKKRIPASKRRWIWTDKIWVIQKAYEGTVRKLCNNFFDGVLVVGGGGEGGFPPIGPPENDSSLKEKEFLEESAARVFVKYAPPEALKGLYREIAKVVHPDNGGSGELMIKVNAAWEILKEFRGIK